MLQVYHWTQGTEFAQARHAEMLADAQSQRTARRAVRHQRAHLRAQVRFFRLYHLRRLLFRFAPGLADRVAL